MKRTKIVATIGPASESPKTMAKMFKAGLDVARLNFSHNVHRHHLMLMKNLRATAKKQGKNIAILQDLQGPRIRIGDVGEKGVSVKTGEEVVLFYSNQPVTKKTKPVLIPIHYQNLYRDLKKGDLILIDDALIRLEVKEIKNKEIFCRVLAGGKIKTRKGMNFPKSAIKASPLTEKDLADLAFGIKNKVDFVALSFVKDARDIINLRKKIMALERKFGRLPRREKSPQTKIIAKIERREAVKNFDSILKTVDGIMVARGDLGIELPFEDVPLIQKEIIKKCNLAAKPVIVATQMLDSMIRNPLPTRAEVSDVANAILDGTDAIMLSGESATGLYPLAAVEAMTKIAKEVEPTEFKLQQELEKKLKRIKSMADFAAFNAQDLAEKMKAKAIICFTKSGYTARMIIRYKSRVPLFVFTPSEAVKNQLNLSWGVEAHQAAIGASYPEALKTIFNFLKKNKKAKAGDTIIVCAGRRLPFFKGNNFIKVEAI
ncbi:MAG: pyruvate kinase [Patescibacteria group bacterium]